MLRSTREAYAKAITALRIIYCGKYTVVGIMILLDVAVINLHTAIAYRVLRILKAGT